MQRDHDGTNILLIMLDQWRFDWLGAAGAAFVATPEIDRIAARGRRFTSCFVASPLCVPSRIALATGLDAARAGALTNEVRLAPAHTTYYQRLRDGGYRVGCVGKLDLAKPDAYNGIEGRRPQTYRWGFTDPLECEGKAHAGGGIEPFGPYTRYLAERGLLERFHHDYRRRGHPAHRFADSVLPAEDFEDAFIGRAAVDLLRAQTGEYPWHLFVSFVGPHDPYDPPTAYAERFRAAAVPDPAEAALDDRPILRKQRQLWSREDARVARRQYTASLALIDEQVGALMRALAASGAAERTWVVVTADHGDMLGDLGYARKSVPYDPATRVPLIIAGPGIAPGRSDALVQLHDLNPSICELAGLPPQPGIDARSLVPLLRGERAGHREACVFALAGFAGVRTRDRLYVRHQDGAQELYDMDADPQCTRNRVAEASGEAQRLEPLLAPAVATQPG
jgi:choline-sulfatase